MKKFVCNFFKLIILFLIILFSTWFLNLIIIQHKNKFSEKNDLQIVGNSHSEVSIIPDSFKSIFSHVENNSQSGRSLFWVVKGISTRPLTNNIIIEFTNNSLTTDSWTYDNNRLLREKRVALELDYVDWRYLFAKNPLQTVRLFLAIPMFWEKQSGCFSANFRERLKEDYSNHGLRIKKQYRLINKLSNDLYGFKSLHNYILRHPKQTIFIVRAPLHNYYFNSLKENSNEILYLNCQKKLGEFKNISILDFGHLELNDSFFADLDHLNYGGAQFFSSLLNDTITSYLNVKDNHFVKNITH